MTASRSLSPAAAAIRRQTLDRVHDALPVGRDVTPAEAWRLAGRIGAPSYSGKILHALAREGRIIRAGTEPTTGGRIGANLYRRRL